MSHILLLGAGFSRNWGGWLAAEAFEYLLGHPKIDSPLQHILWKHRRSDGFEGALGELQDEFFRSRDPLAQTRLRQLEAAIGDMFADMDKGFEATPFEFQNDIAFQITTFLAQFDAIFTLNQDLLLERHYLNDNVMLRDPRRWNGWQIPGMRPEPGPDAGSFRPGAKNMGIWVPDGGLATLDTRYQPYIKLHGSSNWRGANDRSIMVLGNSKRALIDNFPVLPKYHQHFRQCLSASRAHLRIPAMADS
jgi:hypothetical protein